MTRLTSSHKKQLAALLEAPARYRELKPVLEGYMSKTPYRRFNSFEGALRTAGLLHQLELKAENGQTTALYASVAPENWDPYQVARALCPGGYFCNLTSLYYHALTNQVPSMIYVATEGRRVKDNRRTGPTTLSDDAIFDAFVQPHRVSTHTLVFQGHEISITERVSRNFIGVETVRANRRVCPKGSRVTSLERALIDAVVLPHYNGGLATTIEVFRKGLPHASHRRLLDIYDGLAYVYPYWQSIGFLCEKVGAHDLAAAIVKEYAPRNKFYLDHGAKTSWEYDAKWQIYYPKGVL